jgi:polyhydroxyalkanoate synthesis regulator protein
VKPATTMPEKQNAPADSILIKRYAHRRFYNTAALTCLSLEDLTKMVLGQQRFIVRDAETGNDITREILDRLQ